MYSAQPHLKQARNNRRTSAINPNEIDYFTDEKIHHYPNSIQKSIRLHKHRIRPALSHKSSKDSKFNEDLVRNINQQLNANINICRVFQQEFKETPQEYSINMLPVPKQTQDFQNTADRMYSIRKRLSPLKKNKPQYKRAACSVDSPRQVPVQRATFLNIQKLELIKIYSQIQKKVDSTRGGDTLEQRYQIMPQILQPQQNLTRQMQRYVSEDNSTKDIVVSLRRTLREGHTMKWQATKQRSKPFQPPFERYFYKDFIWKIAFSNGLLLSNLPQDTKLKVYVGKGNNSQLVRGFLKRRSWWTFTQKWEQANLVWTQLKINNFFNLQSISQQRYKSSKIPILHQVLACNELNLKIMNQNDTATWDKYFRQNRMIEEKLNQEMNRRSNIFKKQQLIQLNLKTIRIQNHMSQNFVIGNKKALLYTMRQYYQSNNRNVFDFLPLSFHLSKGIQDQQYSRFLGYFYERKKSAKKQGTNNVWIVKPGELTNRGNGIIVCLTLQEIKSILKRGGKHQDGTPKTFIVQEYIERPFLYQKRKFDIRHYILVTSVNGRFKGYWFNRGYIRTSSAQYTLQNGFASVHLTNDAVQKNLPDYGRFEKGNKVSYQDFQTYLDKQYPLTYNFFETIFPKMKHIATDVIRASARTLDPKNLQHNFQIFGLDFMIDGQFRPWLIEVNSNPCLELSCPLLASIIPDLVQNTMKICVDSLVGPPANFQQKRPRFTQNTSASNQFTLVYDSVIEESQLRGAGVLSSTLNLAELDKEEDEEFQDDGQAIED